MNEKTRMLCDITRKWNRIKQHNKLHSYASTQRKQQNIKQY